MTTHETDGEGTKEEMEIVKKALSDPNEEMTESCWHALVCSVGCALHSYGEKCREQGWKDAMAECDGE